MKEHHPWNYIYYLYRIRNKDETDFNGIESYVFEMSKPKSNTVTDWFPKD